MKVAIMQPYVFPYIGYFQLIQAVDTFVLYDDVNYIKKGFINRNYILVNGKAHQFTIPVKEASQNKPINQIQVLTDDVWRNQFYKTIAYNYKKAPYYEMTLDIIEKVFHSRVETISELAIKSVEQVCCYLGLEKSFQVSSKLYSDTKGLEKSDRLISISKKSGADHYVNPHGGNTLYSKDYFALNKVKLSFIENELVPYRQFNEIFVSGLSIIDVLMFNSKEETNNMLNRYKLH
jgi:hypothetical protein